MVDYEGEYLEGGSYADQAHRWVRKYQQLMAKARHLRSIAEQQAEEVGILRGMDYSRPVVQVSPSQDAIPDAVARRLEIKERMDRLADDAADRAREISDAIMRLADERHQTILLAHYVEGVTWERLCTDCEPEVTYRTMMRWRKLALTELYSEIPHVERMPEHHAL